ncbi:phosphate ABC transporter permease subunit PstC [Oscillatoria salina]|uniref:phosphate ABC transporter permease subunit PstC n=1 Tax=Oscillatoria salina TaxID=331517 RepID=UPI0013BE0D04|nr:phosphate ABC transporter permease subunit PstC [Oscillatoria salina]MBZ8178879.1 phosphate ABC transporter permease subunit PstC [Oscillatoria salina IIICB1]NET86695.1 phosphate ABC transporter permease subunit PstC [Kamptonema sp. SIO1D9]
MTTATNNTQTENKHRSGSEKSIDKGFFWLTLIFAFAIAAILLWIAVEVGIQAFPAIREFGWSFLSTSAWNPVEDNYGVLPTIYGTIVSSLIALLIAFPIGLAIAIVLSENFLPKSIRTVFVFMVELLAAIPSVVYGLWGIYVLIPFLKPIGSFLHNNFAWIPLFSTPYRGPGMLPAGVILSIMILPIFTTISRDSLASLPGDLRSGSYAVGSSRWQTIFSVLIPAAFSGIIGGLMLALGRALGETMAVTLVIGNSNDLDFSLLAPANTIASLMANQFPESSGLQKDALMYAGLILFAITLLVNILAESIIRKVKKY